MDFYYDVLKENNIGVYLPNSNIEQKYTIPDNYYINPNGLLYNDIGDLTSTYNLIKEALFNNSVSLEKELKNELENYKRILESNTITIRDIKNYLNIKCDETNNPLLKNLVIGTISSKIILLEKFKDIKKRNLYDIINQSNDNIDDILVRYCGFHKIESKNNRVITTTSLDKDNFKKYIDNYYTINVVPKIELNYVLVEDTNFLERLHILVRYQESKQFNEKTLKKAK